MAHYLVKNGAGEIQHVTGRKTMAQMAAAGWKVVEMWFT